MTGLKKGAIPLYHQIEIILRNRIASGNMKTGDRFPTEMDLCDEFGVSRATVRQAIKALTSDGLIKSEQGRGTTIVTNNRHAHPFRLEGTLKELLILDEHTKMRILTKKLMRSGNKRYKEMQRAETDPVYFFELVRTSARHEDMTVYSRVYVSQPIGEGIDTKQDDAIIQHIYSLVMQHTHRINQTIKSVAADPDVASWLKIAPDAPVLFIKRIYFDRQGTVLQHAESFISADVYEMETELIMSMN